MNDRPDRGVTLAEVLITVVLLSLISGLLAVVFTVVVRSRPAAEARLDDARSLLGITNWLPGDVNSTPVQPVSTATPEWWNVDPTCPREGVGCDPGIGCRHAARGVVH